MKKLLHDGFDSNMAEYADLKKDDDLKTLSGKCQEAAARSTDDELNKLIYMLCAGRFAELEHDAR